MLSIFKKFIFAIPFIISLSIFCNLLHSFLGNSNFIFDLSINTLIQSLLLTAVLLLAALFFVIFATLASSWFLVVPVVIVASTSSFIFFDTPSSIYLFIGFALSFGIIYWTLFKKLAGYLDFKPNILLTPSIKQLSTLLLLISAVTFYLVKNEEIATHGFTLPSSLVDLSLKFSGVPDQSSVLPQEVTSSLPQISADQITQLKQNPQLLKQFGLDPTVLDNITQTQTPAKGKDVVQDFTKSLISEKLNSILKPYLSFIAPLFAILFFFTFSSLIWIPSLFLSPIVLFLFWIMEKTGFTAYQTEMREVKKLVV